MPSREAVFNLSVILENAGFDAKARRRIKLIRHTQKSLKEAYPDYIEYYQAEQKPSTFQNCDYVFSFIGEEGNSARFLGCYKVGGYQPVSEVLPKLPEKYREIRKKWEDNQECVYFDLQKTNILESLQNRLIVQWKNPISWNQWGINDMPVIAISSRKPFPGYESISLTYQELKEIIEEQNSEWLNPLSKVDGVYLITTPKGLYVGAAYNAQGIWNRWKEYVDTKHGNHSTRLKELVDENPEICNEFRFSLLKVFPKRSTPKDVIDWENHFMKVLQTRNSPWGMNVNGEKDSCENPPQES